MNKTIFKWYPEILVYLTFLLMGTFFGFVIHFYTVNKKTLHIYKSIGVYPYFTGGIAALVTGLVMARIKIQRKRFMFEHFYFIMFGVLALFTSGMFILLERSDIDTYIGFMGHGICYVAGLSYINIRISKTRFRFVILSIPHFMYLMGVGIANFIIYSRRIDRHNYIEEISVPMGGTISFIAFMLMGGYITAEVLQYNGRCIYKASLDDDITLENNNETIFEHKYFPFGDDPNNELSQIDEFDKQLEYSHLLYAVCTKGISVMHFYYPFFKILQYISSEALVIMSLNWFALIGLVISMLVLPFVKYKIHFVSACALKIAALLVLSTLFGEADDLDDLLVFIGFYAVSSYGYSFPDINILSYANLKYNEIVLAAGYILEYLIIGTVQYVTLRHPKVMLDYTNYLSLMLPHSIKFIIIILTIGTIGMFKIPKGKLQKSLFELKNHLYNERILVREYFPHPYSHSDTTSQTQLINSSLSSSEEFQQPTKGQLYRTQQLVVQKRINDVLDEQEAGSSDGQNEQSTSFAPDRKLNVNIESYNYKVGELESP